MTSERPETWTDVLEAEYEALTGAPAWPSGPPPDPDVRLRALYARLHQRRTAALCLSGGGVRSATFALGVLQGLARTGVLGKLDYLSTVSGGGYIGGWLTTWLHREDRAAVLRALDPEQPPDPAVARGHSPIDRVRASCRYLAPRGGADNWTLAATMGRNMVLNWLVLLPLIGAVLLVPRAYAGLVNAIDRNTLLAAGVPCLPVNAAPFWLLAVVALGAAVPIGYVVMNFAGRGERWSESRFLAFVVGPLTVSAVALTLFWAAFPCELAIADSIFLSAVLPAAGWVIVGAIARPARPALIVAVVMTVALGAVLFWATGLPVDDPQRRWIAAGLLLLLVAGGAVLYRTGGDDDPDDACQVRIRVGPRTVIAALLAGPVVGGGTYWFARYYFQFGDTLGEAYAVFAVPGILALALGGMMLFIAFASRELNDAALEWWSRCAAWIAMVAAAWLVAAGAVFFLADLVDIVMAAASKALALERRTSMALVAVLVPLLSSLAGLGARSDDGSSLGRVLLRKLAVPVAVVVLIASVAWGDLRGVETIERHAPELHAAGSGLTESLLLMAILAAIGLGMSRVVPANQFSLHGMYRQRLMRTFLGASRRHREPNAFTGFDARDDVNVHELRDVRPLHVVNATLNDTERTDTGSQETLAHPFSFSPLHVGSPVLGFRRADVYGADGGGRATGVSLATAIAVSGAAASPEMGMYSSKARAFLLTLANGRLGLWFGNPVDETAWQRSEPPLGVTPLLRELLGLTTHSTPDVYLSDGGHFENLGLHGMVARRCSCIIVSDAGCDPTYSFADLSNAVRRIRLDLGIPIEFDALDLSREGQGRTNRHGAVGRIRYSVVDGADVPDGMLLYLKATLSGDESVDLRNFALVNPAFPHDSTGNQFFDEAHFESYRALGYHTVMSVAPGLEHADPRTFCVVAADTLTKTGSVVAQLAGLADHVVQGVDQPRQ